MTLTVVAAIFGVFAVPLIVLLIYGALTMRRETRKSIRFEDPSQACDLSQIPGPHDSRGHSMVRVREADPPRKWLQ